MTIERIYISSIDQSNAISATECKEVTRDDMAQLYAGCIVSDELARRDNRQRVDWVKVNEAITRRWPKGLIYIKKKAWKMITEN